MWKRETTGTAESRVAAEAKGFQQYVQKLYFPSNTRVWCMMIPLSSFNLNVKLGGVSTWHLLFTYSETSSKMESPKSIEKSYCTTLVAVIGVQRQPCL